MASLSEEEENYVRMSLLLTGVSPRAVRCKFDKEFAPAVLKATIKREFNKLFDLKGKRIINSAQWNVLYPRNGNPDSKNFDITLMICLLRNIATITPPSYGFDSLPPEGEITDGADLARIKYYRNYLAHLDDAKIDNSYFNSTWTDVADESEVGPDDAQYAWPKVVLNYLRSLAPLDVKGEIKKAICRLGGPLIAQECQDLKVRILDQSNKELLLEIRQSCNEIRDLRQFQDSLQEKVENLKSSYDGLKSDNDEKTKAIHNLTRACESLQNEHDDKQQKIEKLEKAQNDPVPWNIRVQITEKISSWGEDDKEFVETRAAKLIMKSLKTNNCVTVTGSPGMGKTATVRHVALQMQDEHGYDIIPITDPGDIIKFYNPNQKTLYVVDNLCGTYNLNFNDRKKWQECTDSLKNMLEKNLTKLIVTCRLQVYKDEKFEMLSFFKSCVCNFLSDDLSLLQTEKQYIAEQYLETELANITEYFDMYDCFPLLCKLCKENNVVDIADFFQNPFLVYEAEVEKLRTEGEGYKYCALALCVIFNNNLKEEWLTKEVEKDIQKIIENTCEGCKLNRGTSRLAIRDELDSLVHTFIKKLDGIYRAKHDRLFDFFAFYFGKMNIDLLIKNARSRFICERFVFNREEHSDPFTIVVPTEYQEKYIQRMFDDWSRGQVADTFLNRNMSIPIFREKFKQHFNDLQVLMQNQLIHQCDVDDKDSVLMLCSYTGDIEMLHWCIDHGVDVNYCGHNELSSLYIASQNGQTEIVTILLNNKADINKCSHDGASPLFIACVVGHVEIVNILLDNKADVNKCTEDGITPLFIACGTGLVEIVKLLLNSNADLNMCSTLSIKLKDDHVEVQVGNNVVTYCKGCFYNGTDNVRLPQQLAWIQDYMAKYEKYINTSTVLNKDISIRLSPLLVACLFGHVKIVKILLDNKTDIDISTHDLSPLYIACQEGYIEIVKMLLDHKADVNECVKDEISPLNIASFMGHVEIVKILLNNNADINKCKDNGASPLFIACQEGHKEVVKILLKCKADINTCIDIGASPLSVACRKRHVEVVKILLNSKADINKCMDDEASPLYIACRQGHGEVVKILLNVKADINKCKDNGASPLYVACQEGHKEVVKILLNSEADINKCMDDDTTPLYIACQGGHVEVVEMLLNSKADINKCIENDISPLFIACQEGHAEVVKILLDNKADIYKCRDDDISPLFMACQKGHVEVVKILLNNKADINKCMDDGTSHLTIACREGHVEVVKLLLNSKADIDKCIDGEASPLYIACQEGHVEVVKILLKNKADINKCVNDETCPLSIACQKGHLEVVKILLNNKADINKCKENGVSPLYIASQEGHVEVVKLLLNSKAEINKCTDDGISPLYIASQEGHEEVVKILLKNKADINKCVNDETCPLSIACQEGHLDVVKILLNNKADINKCKENGVSPLYIASQEGHVEVVKLLLNSKADINKCIYDGISPLYIASQEGHVEVVTILLNSKADINKSTDDGVSPLYIACQNGHKEIVKILLNSKADINKSTENGASPLSIACQVGHIEVVKILLNSKADIHSNYGGHFCLLPPQMTCRRTKTKR